MTTYRPKGRTDPAWSQAPKACQGPVLGGKFGLAVSLAALQPGEVVPNGRHCGMVGEIRIGRLDYRQGPLVLGLGAGEVPQGPQHEAEVAAVDADAGVVGAKG